MADGNVKPLRGETPETLLLRFLEEAKAGKFTSIIIVASTHEGTVPLSWNRMDAELLCEMNGHLQLEITRAIARSAGDCTCGECQ